MLQSVLFFLILGLPFLLYLLNAYLAQRDARRGLGGGIAGGIPKPKAPKQARTAPRKARVRRARTANCGRTFSHFALALVGSSSACRYCTYLEPVSPPDPPPGADEPIDETEAAIRAAEEIIDRFRQ
ncbi:MAG: hypothetical protein KatS3mg062_0571 [Tepidiforma sp.]|nr:MAG: hypothetical protein KatS3mg062_0571 [Tepidiforma sp.]